MDLKTQANTNALLLVVVAVLALSSVGHLFGVGVSGFGCF
jgi:hypothetical protein